MPILLFGWFFSGLIYFKVFVEAASGRELSIIAAILMAMLLATTVFLSAAVYAKKLREILIAPAENSITFANILKQTFGFYLFKTFLFLVVSRLIVSGFSDRLDSVLSRRDPMDEEIVFFYVTPITDKVALKY